ncbi:DUF1292 domain-containing protein [Thermoactinomyces mirandus]|uniref:DUF1292 domain-containing protein n=1 Tax=Thermoactinomyces mirandus TaxID=2756294 RepID=A0A7W1XQC3_9BACL|nr:DUF1292 domain-containing protein [Thermoactinomyces mirandus]MBA4601318.1 DUF1292 domain-containing protein [Thermoactinomyces mirandus]
MNSNDQFFTGAREVNILRQQFPDQAVMNVAGEDAGTPYRVVNEVEVNGRHYALLQKDGDHPDDVHLFHVNQGRIEEIEDELEWENIAEAVDEMLYFHDFQ